MTYCLAPEVVIEINKRLDAVHGLLDRGKLEGALGRPMAGFGNTAAFPTLVGKAAALLEGLALAHAFFDGNKRTAWLSMTTFLAINGLFIVTLSPEEAGGFVLDVVEHRLDTTSAAVWVTDRLQ